MLKRIKTLKEYCKIILNEFFNNKKIDDDKKSCLYDKFYGQIENLLLNMLKLLKIPGFFLPKLSNSRFFNSFQGKVTTLYLVSILSNLFHQQIILLKRFYVLNGRAFLSNLSYFSYYKMN